ncbi:MAG: hypothetical protein K2I92_01170 [Muribaculaceae bacterium]|nr:hypothetical protein [Muribaculaceae bacterium]
MRYSDFQLAFLSMPFLLLSSCSRSDGPAYDVFMQVSSIKLDGTGAYGSRQLTYDSYGRIEKYNIWDGSLHLNAEYKYVSDTLVKIHTEEIVEGQNGSYDIMNIYEEELHLDNGRADYCEGTVTRHSWDTDPYEQKYRHDFIYTMDNHLNVMKITEWEKLDGKWNDEAANTWENYYVWEDVNLVEIEDYSGKYAPQRFYSYSYKSIKGVQNILEIPMVYYHYYPLQLKGMFGPMSVNLISERRISGDDSLSVTSYDYDVSNGRIVGYSATQDNWTDTYVVQWTP